MRKINSYFISLLLLTVCGVNLGAEMISNHFSILIDNQGKFDAKSATTVSTNAQPILSAGNCNEDISPYGNDHCTDPCHTGRCHFGHCSHHIINHHFNYSPLVLSFAQDTIKSMVPDSAFLEGLKRPPRFC